MSPQHRMMILGSQWPGEIRLPDDVSVVIDPVRQAVVAAQCAKILHASLIRPNEGMVRKVPRRVRLARHFASIVLTGNQTARAAKAHQIRHYAVLPNERILGWHVECEAATRVQ